MAELFGVTVPTINYHLGQIEQSGEIHLSEAIRKILIPSDKCSVDISDVGVYFSILIHKEAHLSIFAVNREYRLHSQ